LLKPTHYQVTRLLIVNLTINDKNSDYWHVGGRWILTDDCRILTGWGECDNNGKKKELIAT
jgi:hypothetical protein